MQLEDLNVGQNIICYSKLDTTIAQLWLLNLELAVHFQGQGIHIFYEGFADVSLSM